MNKIPIINQIIKDRRNLFKLNQSDFAKLINKSLPTVKKYDTGTLIPENTLILICNKLHLDIDKILYEQSEENKDNNTNFYRELIQKKDLKNSDLDLEKLAKILVDKVVDKANTNDSFSNQYIEVWESIEKTLNFLFAYSLRNDLFCVYQDKKFYIKKRDTQEIILSLTVLQAKKFLKEITDFFDYQLYKLIINHSNK